MQGLVGYAALLLGAWLFGQRFRRGPLGAAGPGRVPWRVVVGGLLLQWLLAVLLLRVPAAQHALLLVNDAVEALQRATDAGTAFLFGYLGGGPLPFAPTRPDATFILAFKMLPLVLVISALSALLFHWGVMQRVVGAFAALLRRALGLGGALSVAAAAHVFVGMVEAPLLIRPYLRGMARGEIFAAMTCGMAGVAGTVMVIYGAVLAPVIPNALGTIVAASVISTPAALAVAALMLPWDPAAAGDAVALDRQPDSGAIDALVRGTAEGVPVLVGIVSVLLVTVTLVTLCNAVLGVLPLPGGPWTLQGALAVPLRPLAWLIGVPWAETAAAAGLLASKTVLNEFVAYLQLAALPPDALGARARLVMTVALCGFANLGSVGILVGGLAAMMGERRAEVAALGLRSLVAGTLATCLSGAVAGVVAP